MATKIKLRRLLALHLTGPVAKPFENNQIGIQKSKNPFADKLLDREIEIGSKEEATALAAIENFNGIYFNNSHSDTFSLDETIRVLFKNLPLPADSLENVITDFFNALTEHQQLNPSPSRNNDEELILLEDDEEDISASIKIKLNRELEQVATVRQLRILNQLLDPELPPVRQGNIRDLKNNLGYLSEAEYLDFLVYLFIDPSISEAKINDFITTKRLDGILSDVQLKTARDNKPKTKQHIKESLQNLLGIENEDLETLTNKIYIKNIRNLIKTKLSTPDNEIKLIDIIELVTKQNIELDNVLKEKSIDEINNFTNDLITITIDTPLETIQNTIKNFFGRDSKFYKTQGENLAIDLFISQKLHKLKEEHEPLFNVLKDKKADRRNDIKKGLNFSEQIEKLKQPFLTKDELKKSLGNPTEAQIHSIYGLNQYSFLIQQLEGQIPNSLIEKLNVNKNAIINIIVNLEPTAIKAQIGVLTSRTKSADEIKQAFQQLTGNPQPDNSQLLKHFHEAKRKFDESLKYFTHGRPIFNELLEQANSQLITFDTVDKFTDAKNSTAILADVNNQANLAIEDALRKIGIDGEENNAKLIIAENKLFISLRDGTLRADIKALIEHNHNFERIISKIANVDYELIKTNLSQLTQPQTELQELIQLLESLDIPEAETEAQKIYATNQIGNLNVLALPSYIQALLNIPEVKSKFAGISNAEELKILNSCLKNLNNSSDINTLETNLSKIGLTEAEAKRHAKLLAILHNTDATRFSIQAALEALKVKHAEKEASHMYGKNQLEKHQNDIKGAAAGTIDELIKNFINDDTKANEIITALGNISSPDTIDHLFEHLLNPNVNSKNKSAQLNTLFAGVTGTPNLEKYIDIRQKYHQLLKACDNDSAPELKKLLVAENAQNEFETHFTINKEISISEILNGLGEIEDIKKKEIVKEGEPPVDKEVESVDENATTNAIKQFLTEKLGLSSETIDKSSANLMILKKERENYLVQVKYQSIMSGISNDLIILKDILQQPQNKAKILKALNKNNAVPIQKIISEIENAVTVEKLITVLGKIGLSSDDLDDETRVNNVITEIRKSSFKKSPIAQRNEVIDFISSIPETTFSPPVQVEYYQTLFNHLTSHNSNIHVVYRACNQLKQVSQDDLEKDESLSRAQREKTYSFYAKNIIYWLNQEANLPLTTKNVLKKHLDTIEKFIISKISLANYQEPDHWKRKFNQLAEARSINALKTCLNELGIKAETITDDEISTLLKTNPKNTVTNHVDFLKKNSHILASVITTNPKLTESFVDTTSSWEPHDFAIRLKRIETQLRQSADANLSAVLHVTPNGIIKEADFNLLTPEQKTLLTSNAHLESLRESAPNLYHWFTLVAERHDIAAKLFDTEQKALGLLNEIKIADDPIKLRLILTRELSSLSLSNHDLSDDTAKQIIGEQRIPILLKQWFVQSGHWSTVAKQLGSMTEAEANEAIYHFIFNIGKLDKPNLNTTILEINKILSNPVVAAGLANKGGISQDDAFALWQSSKLFTPFLKLKNASSQDEIENQLDAIKASLKNFKPTFEEDIKKKKEGAINIEHALNEIQTTPRKSASKENIQKLENLQKMLDLFLQKLRDQQKQYQTLKDILETKVNSDSGKSTKTQLVTMIQQTSNLITQYESLLDQASEKISEYRILLKNQHVEAIKNIAIRGGFKVEVFNNKVSIDEKNDWITEATSNPDHSPLGNSSVVIDSVEQRKSVTLNSPNERVYYAKSINNNGVLVLSQNNQNTRLESLPFPENPLERKQALQETAINFFLSCLERDKQNGKMIHTFKGKAGKGGITRDDIKYIYSLVYALNLHTKKDNLALINDSDFQVTNNENFKKYATRNLIEAKRHFATYGITTSTTTNSINEAINTAEKLNQSSTFSPRR